MGRGRMTQRQVLPKQRPGVDVRLQSASSMAKCAHPFSQKSESGRVPAVAIGPPQEPVGVRVVCDFHALCDPIPASCRERESPPCPAESPPSWDRFARSRTPFY